MSHLKNKMSVLLANILTSCEESTFLLSKRQHEKLSLKENINIKIHLLTCHACRSFVKQINFLSKCINKLKKEDNLFQLSPEEKSQIQQNLRDELQK
jgi:predicted anti-sigma-YlaC factor YlaD